MLNLNSANRLYTDIEILEKAAKYLHVNDEGSKTFDYAIDMLSKILDYHPDYIKGFAKKTIQDLTKG